MTTVDFLLDDSILIWRINSCYITVRQNVTFRHMSFLFYRYRLNHKGGEYFLLLVRTSGLFGWRSRGSDIVEEDGNPISACSSVMPESRYRGSPQDPLRISLELEHKLGGSSGDPQGIRHSVTPGIILLLPRALPTMPINSCTGNHCVSHEMPAALFIFFHLFRLSRFMGGGTKLCRRYQSPART